MRLLIVCFIGVLGFQLASGVFFVPAIAMMRNINIVVTFTQNAMKLFGYKSKDPNAEKLHETQDKVVQISEQLDHFGEEIKSALSEVFGAIQRLEKMLELKDAQHNLQRYIGKIQSVYEEFEAYVDDIPNFQRKTIEKFVDILTSPAENELPDVLKKMYRLYAPGDTAFLRESILDQVLGLQNMNGSEVGCNNVMTIQQHISELYNFALVHELKAFGLLTFAYGILGDFDNKPYTRELEKVSAQTILRMNGYLLKAREVMAKARTRFVLCDPKEWVRDKTFAELEGVIQSYLVGENQVPVACAQIDTSTINRCYKKANYRKHYDPWVGEITQFDKRNPYTEVCLKRFCEGHIHECDFIGAPTVCELENTVNRYQWIKGHTDIRLGPQDTCKGQEQFIDVTQKTGYDNFCLCECIQNKPTAVNTTRAFSLIPQLAEIEYNMVVTGLRFLSQDNVMRIQIEQGVLNGDGKIEEDTVEWLPVEKLKYKGNKIHEVGEDGSERPLKADEDYAMVGQNLRRMSLDSLNAPKNKVITGVRLSRAKEATGDLIQLEIQVSSFNNSNGDLLITDDDPSVWISPQQLKGKTLRYSRNRTEVLLNQPDNPVKADLNEKDSHANQFIEFQMSDLFKDVGGHTVPFFDIQEVHPNHRVGLGGIGLFHKGKDEFGGFLAFDVKHLNYALNVGPELTREQVEHYEKLVGKKKAKAPVPQPARGNRKVKQRN